MEGCNDTDMGHHTGTRLYDIMGRTREPAGEKERVMKCTMFMWLGSAVPSCWLTSLGGELLCEGEEGWLEGVYKERWFLVLVLYRNKHETSGTLGNRTRGMKEMK